MRRELLWQDLEMQNVHCLQTACRPRLALECRAVFSMWLHKHIQIRHYDTRSIFLFNSIIISTDAA